MLLTAVRAEGVTELRNAAIEPEIMDLIAVLQKMGAIISYEPNRVIVIEGVEKLRGYDHRSIFDRNEAASWASAALATDGEIFVGGAKQQEMLTFLNIFRKAGGWFDIQEDGILFRRDGDIKPVVIETDVHPGFMTDWQQPLVVALTQAHGRSVVHETVYENRMGFTDALVKMGADIVVHPPRSAGRAPPRSRRDLEQAAVITGPTPLHGADIVVPDLRGGYSHIIAALNRHGRVAGVGCGYPQPRLREVPRQARRARRRLRRHPVTEVTSRSSETTRPSIFWPLAALVIPPVSLIAKIRVSGAEKLPQHGSFILAPNHYSEFDPLIVAVAVWRAGRAPRFMAKESLFKVPVLGWFLHRTGMIPVARTSSASSARQTMKQVGRAGGAWARSDRVSRGHSHA